MKPYGNKSGNSGVIAYETGPDSLIVRFRDGTYLYDNAATGPEDIRRMKELATSGKGLSTYISQHVKSSYAKKLD